MNTAYQLYATGTATTAAAAMWDARNDGTIRGIHLNVVATGANAGGGGIELSFGSTANHTTNDTMGVIASLYVHGESNATPVSAVESVFLDNLDIPLQAGERLYVHLYEEGTTTAVRVRATLYVEEKGGLNRPSTRRR